MTSFNIAIAGCGVAGLSCAALLARAGHRVTVLDKLASPAPIGSGLILQPVGLAVLDEIGAGARLREAGARIDRLYGKTEPSGRIVLDVRYATRGPGATSGVAVHRGALFDALMESARSAGVQFELGRDVARAETGALVTVSGAKSNRFDLVIDALGMRSPLAGKLETLLEFGALWANVPWPGAPFDPNALEQRYERASKMAGVLPIGGGQAAFFWSLKGVDYNAWRTHGLDVWKVQVEALWPALTPLLAHIKSERDLVFARYAHRTLSSPISRGVVHVGDSWHCASPQLGQGANMALLDAFALARAFEAHAELADALGAYARARLWHIRLYQLASFLFTPAYQSDSSILAFVRDWLMAPISRLPPGPRVLAALVAGEVGAPLRAIGRIGAKPEAAQALAAARSDA